MKEKVFKIFMIIMVLVFCVTCSRYVYADDNLENSTPSCSIDLTPDKTTVKPGEDITYQLKVSNINADNGLKMVEFYVGEYDSSKFDCKVRNYNEDKWSISITEGYISLSSNDSEAWKTDEILAKIIYTPKSGLADNTYQTKITNIKATTDSDLIINIADVNLNIKVDSSQSTSGGTTGGNTTGGSTTGGSSTSGSTTGGSTTGGNTTGGNTTSGGTTSESTSGESTIGGSTTSESTTSGSTTDGNTTSGSTTSGSTTGGSTTGESTTSGSSTSKSTTGTDSTKKSSNNNKSLPYSGDAETLLIIFGIAIFMALSVFFYMRYKRLNIH